MALRGDDFSPLGRGTPSMLRLANEFGTNPGALRCWFVPPPAGNEAAPCVVVLHGCGQTAVGFDAASGWSRLAAEHGFALLYPEQTNSNNSQTCFSWFTPTDTARDQGEAASIVQMLDWMRSQFGMGDVFICGLSAGGAMAAAMLAAYPERFRAGAIIAGLPFGTASGASDAFEAMYNGRTRDPRRWGDLVRDAAIRDGVPYPGPWPAVAIWSGTADAVVRPINGGELVKQWTDVHGAGSQIPATDRVRSATRRVWRDEDGRPCVTAYSLPDFGHGVPVDSVDPPAPFFLPAGLSATRQIAADFGLVEPVDGRGSK